VLYLANQDARKVKCPPLRCTNSVIAQHCQNFNTINRTDFPGTVMKTVTGVAGFKRSCFDIVALYFRQQPIKDHDMNN